jgi:tetratricopeptide (TPR) repeat protein
MFTINIYLKFALIAIFLIGGVALAFIYGLVYSWFLILIGLIFLASYLLLGTIQSAATFVQVQNFEAAEKRLNLTFAPKLLYVANRAIYYIIRGSILMHKKETKEAEELFNKALALNLPSDNEKALVLLQLAGIQANRGNWTGAVNYHKQAKKLKITEPTIKSQIDQLEKGLANRGQLNVARSMGKQGMQMMQGGYGSKRRRPKMR